MGVAVMPIEEVFTINEVAEMLKFNERTTNRANKAKRVSRPTRRGAAGMKENITNHSKRRLETTAGRVQGGHDNAPGQYSPRR